jgi:hypothetical protein
LPLPIFPVSVTLVPRILFGAHGERLNVTLRLVETFFLRC